VLFFVKRRFVEVNENTKTWEMLRKIYFFFKGALFLE
jgi:hypothetical protein